MNENKLLEIDNLINVIKEIRSLKNLGMNITICKKNIYNKFINKLCYYTSFDYEQDYNYEFCGFYLFINNLNKEAFENKLEKIHEALEKLNCFFKCDMTKVNPKLIESKTIEKNILLEEKNKILSMLSIKEIKPNAFKAYDEDILNSIS